MRTLSRVVVYGPCMACGEECVGDSTREIGHYDCTPEIGDPHSSPEWVLDGYAHPGECEKRATT